MPVRQGVVNRCGTPSLFGGWRCSRGQTGRDVQWSINLRREPSDGNIFLTARIGVVYPADMHFSYLSLSERWKGLVYHVPPGEALRSNTFMRSKYFSALKAAAAIDPRIAVRYISREATELGPCTGSASPNDGHRLYRHIETFHKASEFQHAQAEGANLCDDGQRVLSHVLHLCYKSRP